METRARDKEELPHSLGTTIKGSVLLRLVHGRAGMWLRGPECVLPQKRGMKPRRDTGPGDPSTTAVTVFSF